MTPNSETIILNGSKEAVEAINKEITEQPGSQAQIMQRKNLDGDTATWIVVATLASQALPHILNFIKDFVSSNKVKKIKIGDLEIENPTKEMVEEYEKVFRKKLNKISTDE